MKHEALRSANLFDSGCGYLVVSRFKGDGRVEAGFFLLDVFCLGVKDAGFQQFASIADYQEGLIDRFFTEGNSVERMAAGLRASQPGTKVRINPRYLQGRTGASLLNERLTPQVTTSGLWHVTKRAME